MVQFNKFFAIAAILAIAVIVNLVFVDYKLLRKDDTTQEPEKTSESSEQNGQLKEATAAASCLADCQAIIDAKLAQVKDDLLKTLQAPTPKPQQKATTQPTTQPQPKEIFVQFGVNGSTKELNWTDLAGSDLVFDAANYPGAKAFYFQANLKSDAPDRTTFARIYDAIHSIGVQGSDMSYAGLTSTFTESGSLTFWSGKLTLRVQLHSLNGNLATIENPRVRIVY